MIAIDIKISALGDAPLWPHIKPVLKGELTHVGILEAGMKSGDTSLYFIVSTPAGPVTAETSLAALTAIQAIATGADKRFKDKPENN